MPKFVLKISEHAFKMVKGRRKLQKPSAREGTLRETTRETTRVVLGSRPLCDVHVRDRLVPDEALVFEFDGTHVRMEVLKTLGGTFKDGAPVDGRAQVADKATIQIGHTRIDVAVDPTTQTCTLDVGVNALQKSVYEFVDEKKPARAFGLHDAGPQEQRWGKSPVLTRANWFAGLVGLALLASFFVVKDTDAMSRGPLFRAHAIGAKNGPRDCAACHAPMSSSYSPKCAVCHAGFDSTTTHPYAKNADVSCNECHAEHVGADASIVPPMTKTESGWPKTCLRCHAGQPYPAADVPAALVAAAKSRLADARGAPFARQLMVDGFSHKDHRVPGGGMSALPGVKPKTNAPVACAECHKLLAAGATNGAIPTAEFAGVLYPKCLECHADWRVAVHGREQNGAACLVCHAKPDVPLTSSVAPFMAKIGPAMKTVDLPATEMKWVLKPRDHDFKKDDCLKCHVLSKSSLDHRTALGAKVFRHDHHLKSIAPPEGGAFAFSQKNCLPCHQAVAGSETLAGTALVDASVCAKCHVDSEPTRVEVKEGATRRVVDMVHKTHTVDAASLSKSALRYASRESLARGCLSCHEPAVGETSMTFTAGAKDCKACHTGHENLGEGKCVLCHVDRAPGVNRVIDGKLEFRFSEPGIFNAEKATKKTTAAMPRFDHKSAGHKDHACAECHAAPNVDQATRVLDVTWPAFDDDACVKCHVRERFHR